MINLKDILMIIAIISLGLLAWNQFIEWKYKAELLVTPCETCVKLNPEWETCYKYITTPKPTSGQENNINYGELLNK